MKTNKPRWQLVAIASVVYYINSITRFIVTPLSDEPYNNIFPIQYINTADTALLLVTWCWNNPNLNYLSISSNIFIFCLNIFAIFSWSFTVPLNNFLYSGVSFGAVFESINFIHCSYTCFCVSSSGRNTSSNFWLIWLTLNQKKRLCFELIYLLGLLIFLV